MDSTTESSVIGVAELDRRLKRAAEGVSAKDWVQGEIGALKRATSGHVYFSLKDEQEDALIDCVMYRFPAQRARGFLDNGNRVQLKGRATLWAPRGRLQFVAEALRPAGRGELLVALERLKKRLHAEGLFDAERKRALPSEPRCIGVITSAHGAAWRDIRAVAHRRGAVRLILVPALVQGEMAPESLLRALALVQRHPDVEAVIIGRGGGSAEDLSAFNDERVVRAVADCPVPIVSAVGHEVDMSLTDLAADLRAATPSEAAERVVPDRAALQRELRMLIGRLRRTMVQRLEEDAAVVAAQKAKLSDPRFLIAQKQQLLDELRFRQERRVRRELTRRAAVSSQLHQRLASQHPERRVRRALAQLGPLRSRLIHCAERSLALARRGLGTAQVQLEALSPLAILGRGYAIVLDVNGKPVFSSRDAEVGEELSVRLADGGLGVTVNRRLPVGAGATDAVPSPPKAGA